MPASRSRTRWSPSLLTGAILGVVPAGWPGAARAREIARRRGRIGRKRGLNTIFRNGSPNATAATQVAHLQVEEGPGPPRGPRRRARGRRGRRRHLGGRRLQLGAAALQPAAGPEGPLLGDLRRRRQPDRLHPLEQHPPAGLDSSSCPRTSRTRRSRSRTAASSNTARSTSTAIGRAALKNIEAGKTVEGASTITQQLVRNLYIPHPEETIKRKLIEAHLAYEEEEAHSKTWILTEYLNTAPYGTVEGQTAVGAEAAAQTYFGKPAKELSLTEAALIAGLPQAPSEYNPFLDPQAAIERRNEVLDAMEEEGYITSSELAAANEQRPRPPPGPQVQGDPRPLPLRPGPAGADRQIRDQHGPQRRPQGLHDDRPRAPGTRRRSGRARAASATRKGARPPASPRSTPKTARSSPSPRPKAMRPKASSTTPGRRIASRAPRSRPSS